MEIQTQVRVQAWHGSVSGNSQLWWVVTEPEVVVHDEYLCGVLICLRWADGLRGVLGYRPVTTSRHYHITISCPCPKLIVLGQFRLVSCLCDSLCPHFVEIKSLVSACDIERSFGVQCTWKLPSICPDESPQRQWHPWGESVGLHRLHSRGPTWAHGQGRCLKCFENLDSVQIFWSCDDDLTCPKRYNCTRRIGALRILANIVKTLQHPAEEYYMKLKC
mgnify:CR=1 FL=1